MDISGSLIQNSSGEYVFVGTNMNFLPVYGNITKTDMNGNFVWCKGISSSIATELMDVIEVSAANGGGYLLCGYSDPGAILVRLTSTGTLSWARRYQLPDGGGKTSNEYAAAVKETKDGNFIVAGGVDYYWNGTTTADTTMPFAFKVNSSGTILWDRVYVISVSNPDEHYFTDVTESSDGYFFVGASSEGTGTPNDDGDYPRDGLIVKTDASGNLSYARKFGSSGSGEYVNSSIELSTGNILMCGSRGDNGYFMRINGTGSTPTIGFGRHYSRTYMMVIPEPIEYYQAIETKDGHYAALGSYLNMSSLSLSAQVTKINSSNGDLIYGKTYSSGLSSILPVGGSAADTGYYMFMTAQQSSFNYHMIKTDKNGSLNNPACPEGTFTPTENNYSPTLNAITPTVYSNNATSSSFTPAIIDLTPLVDIQCRNIVCVKPPSPNGTATPATICQGQSSTLSASGGTNVTYHYFVDTLAGSFATGASTNVSPTTTTTYYVAAEDNTNPGCFSYMRPVIVTVNPPATANAGTAQTICAGSTVTLAGTVGGGATTGTWTGGSGTYNPNNTTLTAVYTPSAAEVTAGTVTLTLTTNDPAGPCNATSSNVTITINAQPTVNAGPNQTICAGSTATLAGSYGSTATSASWSGGTGTYNPNNSSMTAVYTPSTAEINAGTVTLTLTTNNPAGPCNAVSDNMVITINAQPTVNAGPDQQICAGTSATLAGSFGSTATSATWSGGTGTFTPNNTTMNATYTPSSAEVSAGSVTLTLVTNDPTGPCSEKSDNMLITIYPLPTANAGNDQTICQGSSASLTATGLPGSTYTWSYSVGNTATVNVSPSTTTTYTVSVSDSHNCGTVTDDVIVNVVQAPVINTNPDTICKGSTYQIMANISNYASIQWTTSGTGGFNDATILNPIYTPSASDNNSGSVVLTVTATGYTPCASSNGQIALALIEPAPPILSNADTSLCQSASPYLLTGNPSGGTFSGTGVSSNQFSPGVAGSGTHIITYTISDNHNCTNDATGNITVWQMPTADAGTNQNICSGDTATLTATGLPNSTYEWSHSAGNTATVTVSPTTTTTYTVSVTDENSCGTATDNTIVTVIPLPVITVSDDSICSGNTYQTNITATNFSNISWSSSGSGSFSSSTILNPVYTPSASDINNGQVVLTVTAEGNAPCSNISENINLTILPLPVIIFDSLQGLCLNASAVFLNMATPSGGTYSGAGVNNGYFNPMIAGSGTHTLTYIYTNNFGCSNTKTNTVQVYALPIVTLNSFDNVCVTETQVSVNGGNPQGGYYYGNNMTGNNFYPSTAGTGTHNIYYVYQDSNGCSDTATSTILVVPEVTLSSDAPDNTIYIELGAIVNFTATPSNQGNYVFGIDTTDIQNSNSHIFATNTLESQNIVYVVLNGACSDSLQINIKPVPNAFIPFDFDGNNDIFMPYVDLTILNRWGQELYKGNEGWDGKYNGQNVSPGTYYYIIRIPALSGEDKLITGAVTLVTRN